MNDKPLSKTPGEMLSEAREAKELTLAQLSDRTKIPPPVLAALELDEFHKISGPLYIKSFLRTCAVDLGLDPEEVMGQYNRISGEDPTVAGGADTVWEDQEVKVSRIGLPWVRIVLVAGVGALLIGFGLFSLRGCGGDDSGSEGPAAVAEPETLAVEVVPAEVIPAAVATLPDSLARDGLIIPSRVQSSAEDSALEPESADITAAETQSQIVAAETIVEEPPARPAAAQATVVEDIPTDDASDRALEAESASIPEVVIQSSLAPQIESSWPLVLSIVCDGPQDIRVKRDGDREFVQVAWPATTDTVPEVPAAGFQAGRAYSRDGKLVVFWGADDHFSLKLARVRGVEVAINGRVRDISKLRPGQEIILDSHSAGSSSQR